MSGRKMASIQIVEDVQPIPGADNIEVCTVLGWQAVVLKGKVKPGDVIVYIEIDAIVPDIPVFEFMKNSKFRVRTKKLRGQVSQGLVMALDEVGLTDAIYELGEDVSEQLGISKYEAPIPTQLQGQTKGNRPHWVPKTDEPRYQSVPRLAQVMREKLIYITTKYDGTSMSVYWMNGEFGVCSRNTDLKETEENSYWKCARALKLEEKIKLLGDSVVIQGELCGPGIQRNRLALKDFNFYLFDIYYPIEHRYADYSELIQGSCMLDVDMVHIEEQPVFNFNSQELIMMAKGKYPGTNNNKEGIVIRTVNPGYHNGDRTSFKVVNVDYLLKDEE